MLILFYLCTCTCSVPPVPSPVLTRAGHKRAQSFTSKSFVDDQAALRAMEWDLARQTRKLNKLK